ncbi:MAG TPA: NAD-dependent epimerase/dehydratase family protein [Stellaceae bacterium]|nr:NAD-dependent epimerase/dehydratase family protein [Stellaceae bacterium]
MLRMVPLPRKRGWNRGVYAVGADQHEFADGGARVRGRRFFFASSACVYPDYRQQDADIEGLKEADAYPAMPEDGYGWEKLFSERMCRHFREDFGLEPWRQGRMLDVPAF